MRLNCVHFMHVHVEDYKANVIEDKKKITITRHNQLRDYITDFCCKACLSSVEEGSGILPKYQSRPADILVPNWSLSRPATFDIKLMNLLSCN